MSNQKYIASMTGYKATNADMICKDHQFVLGQWAEIDGDIKLCERGFHFCMHPSGVWTYYNDTGVRVFKCEAEQVLECQTEAGADFKLVARRIRLVEEITPGLKGGNRNTGNRNTGNRNTGDSNTGDSNTGDSNTGYSNTGNRNTGDSNTGNRNTGYSNTGDRNTGYSNTGDSNTGDSNTGNRNTGYSNATNFSPGFFCQKEPKAVCFDKETKLTREKFSEKFPEWLSLSELLKEDAEIDLKPFSKLPGITAKKLKSLHDKMKAARAKK